VGRDLQNILQPAENLLLALQSKSSRVRFRGPSRDFNDRFLKDTWVSLLLLLAGILSP
jgi:hypothetical protein